MKDLFSFKKASQELDRFIESKISSYSKMRNFDLGSSESNYVSYLSPAITRRILTEQYVVNRVLKFFPFNKVEKFIQEICWRTYWKGYLEHRPKIWREFLGDLDSLGYQRNSEKYEKAVLGLTGIECYDNWVNELKDKNYLHNHTRMWFASIWIYTLNLPWQLGAELFLEHLHDADPASNTLSWRWVAGIHTQNKQYIASPENINKFTRGKYYPHGQLKQQVRQVSTWKDYEIIDLDLESYQPKKLVKCVLFHENNLSLQNIPKFDYMFIQKRSLESIKRSKNVHQFINNALENFRNVLSKQDSGKIIPFDFDNFNEVKKYMTLNNINTIYTPYPSIGFVKDKFKEIESIEGINFRFFLPDWDILFWPHAKKGFFKLKKQIKSITSELDGM
tara:strand:- start:1288 stop:2460 length:1173 start_codon:yes stop_codon:yes gene_type:complete